MKEPKVLVALSGGVDSSMAAILLKEQGYDIIGVTLKVYNNYNYRQSSIERGINDASILSKKLKIPYYVIDILQDFENEIISYFIREYSNGRTPNPCALCNYTIKWSKLIEIANEFDCQYVATGHYAKINNADNRYYLTEANDILKDQTYFLWRLNQDFLQRTLFPLGALTKKETKDFAFEQGFTQIAKKKESYNICFIPDGRYRDFLNDRLVRRAGNIIFENGENAGVHNGIWNFTIGQNKGFTKINNQSLYVTRINSEENEIVIGEKDKLLNYYALITEINYMKYESISATDNFQAKINYKSPLVDCSFSNRNGDIYVHFDKPVVALAPGQSIVFYQRNDLVAGGVISKILHPKPQ
ncbi:MAG: tRNA 2-thiouridine(34) synthase MnmA [Bacteroidales bacterium]|nr:tRNA 2-thiouridine(34) synthase MnmA [Bacteroidales bacterium]